MTHSFHTGRYSGAKTVPNTGARTVPAAALVLHHPELRALPPMFATLDAHPEERAIGEIRLVPITVTDFYALPDLRPLGCETHPAGDPQGRPVHVRAGSAVGVPAAGAVLPAGEDGAGGRGRGPRGVAGQEVC